MEMIVERYKSNFMKLYGQLSVVGRVNHGLQCVIKYLRRDSQNTVRCATTNSATYHHHA